MKKLKVRPSLLLPGDAATTRTSRDTQRCKSEMDRISQTVVDDSGDESGDREQHDASADGNKQRYTSSFAAAGLFCRWFADVTTARGGKAAAKKRLKKKRKATAATEADEAEGHPEMSEGRGSEDVLAALSAETAEASEQRELVRTVHLLLPQCRRAHMRGREDQPSDFHHDLDAVDWRRLRTPSPEVGRSSKTYAGVSDLNHGYEAFQSVRQESPIICSTPPPFAMSSSPPPPPEFGSAGNQTLPQLQLRVSSSSAACAEAESIDSPPAPTIARRRKGGKRASTEVSFHEAEKKINQQPLL
eukprot:s2268_g6.t2